MTLEDSYLRDLLTRLDGSVSPSAITATDIEMAPEPDNIATLPPVVVEQRRAGRAEAEAALEQRLTMLRQQLSSLSAESTLPSTPAKPSVVAPVVGEKSKCEAIPPVREPSVEFVPCAPNVLSDVGLETAEIEAIALKFLLNRGNCAGRQLADQLGLPFSLMEKVLYSLKTDQLIAQKGAAALSDYVYQLTPQGVEDARRHYKNCSYFGTLPVPLESYIASVSAQSIRRQQPTRDQLSGVFTDLLVNEQLQEQIGQAVYTGKGFFLYGAPGNGKTSLAERVARAFGQYVWIPRAIGVAGEIVRLFDPCNHEEAPLDDATAAAVGPIDRRWIRIRRPTVIAGGELTMDRLEIVINRNTGVNEAPLQLKSNCGVLVIDDFGRQRMGVAELLNRWIVPLDRRYDFLNLPSGKTIQVPFDQLLVFSTNLEPRDLVDEAFLRRISYKIEVPDPSLDDFRKLLEIYAQRLNLPHDPVTVEYLIQEHYVGAKRPVRACHARDLLDHVRSYCGFRGEPAAMSRPAFDAAVKNYFGLMG